MWTSPHRFPLALFVGFTAGLVLPPAPDNAQPHPVSRSAEDVHFEHLTVVEGLPENSVSAILQDHLGFLWFGTMNGLVKYDGYTFTVYKPGADAPHSLSNASIFVLHEDAAGDLWIGTSGGLNHFDRETERFTVYRHDPADPTSLSHNTIFSILEDRDGVLWLATMGGGLNRFDPSAGTFTAYRHDPADPTGLQDDRVHGLWADDEGRLWVGTHAGGLHRFDPATETFTAYRHDPADPQSLSHDDVNTIYQDREGTLWIGTSGGINRFDPATGRFTVYRHDPADPQSLSHDGVMRILEDRDGVLWIGVGGNDIEGGLNRFDRATGTVTRYQYDADRPASLGGNYVMSLYEDRQGALWVGTWGGVSKWDRTVERFPHYAHDPADPASLSTNQILSLYEDRAGTLWIGTWGGGLDRFDRTNGTFTHYRHDPTDAASPLGNEITVIREDRDGYLWLGSWNGLDRFDPATERFTHYRHDPTDAASLSHPDVSAVYEDRQGVLWVGTAGGGLNRLDRTNGTFTHYRHDPTDAASLSHDTVAGIFEDDGMLWVVTGDRKLNRFDRADGGFDVHPLLGGSVMIQRLLRSEAMPGKYWLGTYLRGLHLYDPEADTSQVFTEKDGLLHDTVLGLLEDDQGHVWVSTARGLSKFDPRTKTFRNYDVTDVLQGNKLMFTAVHKSERGELFFGGSRGVLAFHPEQIRDNPHVPPVVLTDFKLFTESVPVGEDTPLKAHISVVDEIRLAHWQNDISFTFAALNYQLPERNRYAFKLDNYDEAWRYAGDGRTATYTNLAPGAYVFRVTGSNNDDVWNEEGASVRVIIAPPWWKTPWAYGLFLVLGTASVFGLIRWRVRYLERRAQDLEAIVSARTAEVVRQKATIEAQTQKLQELDRLKSRFFANISHEFRTPLSLILGPLQDALDGAYGTVSEALQKRLEMMQRSGFRLLRLINQLLDLSKFEAGTMRLQARRADLVAFLRGIVLSFVSMAECKHITFRLAADREQLALYFDPDKLEKIVFNLLSNAFKFTPEHGVVTVCVRALFEEDQVEIRVEDTGRGIPPAEIPYVFDRFHQVEASGVPGEEGTGIGLALARELVVLHGGTITAESRPGQGATLVVRLPLGEAHLAPEDRAEAAPGDGVNGEAYRDLSLQALGVAASDGGFGEVPPDPLPADAPTILLVEDHPEVRAYVREHLQEHYRIEEAGDGAEALDRIRTRPPDLVISDVMMPVMDGYDLCRTLKADPELNHIPVILLTARAGEESKVEGLEIGADDYIYKPFSADELLARAENLIEIRRLLRRRFSREVVAVQPGEITVTPADQAFLDQVQAVVEAHMGHGHFGAEWLADEVSLSPRQLRRKLKELTGLSTAGYIRSMRLQRAAQLLEEQAGTVSEVAYAVGFQDPKHFSKLFRQVFGMAPSQAHTGSGA